MASKITRETLATAARTQDAAVETDGLIKWADAHGVELEGLHYVANQRALRAAALLIDGLPPSAIPLSERAMALMPVLMACFVDGFAVGLTVDTTEVRDD